MCSLTGVFNLESLTYEVLYKGAFSQQHRGEDGAGVAATNGEKIFSKAKLGLVDPTVTEIWNEIEDNVGKNIIAAIAHTRYPTEGEVTAENAQPFFGETKHGMIAYGHNGELTNFNQLRKIFLDKGHTLTKSSDSEMFLHAYAGSEGKTTEEKLANAARLLKGAFSIVGITKDTLFAVRDLHGFKPLSLAKLNGGYIIASETAAFLDIEGAEWIEDILPGSIITITKEGIKKEKYEKETTWKPCIFETVYFARPDSHIAGRNVHLVRKEYGKQLYAEAPIKADIVIAIEDSGRSAAEGFAEASGIRLERGFIRNHYMGRTFIRPTDILRNKGVNLKLAAVKEVIEGKRVVLIDDSIVRGNTAKSRVRLVIAAGAKEVYLYITSPVLRYDCMYGIDFHKESMRATIMPNDKEFTELIKVNKLVHLSEQGMYEAIKRVPLDKRAQINYSEKEFCTGCFTGKYPVPRE